MAVPVPKSVQLQQMAAMNHYQSQVPSTAYSSAYHHHQHQGMQDPSMMMMQQQGYYYNNNNNYGHHQYAAHQQQQQQNQGRYNNNNGNQNNNRKNNNNNNNKDNNNKEQQQQQQQQQNDALNSNTHIEVYAFNNVALYTIPREDILSMPALDDPSNSQIKNLQLCPHFEAATAEPNATTCSSHGAGGEPCKFVHARLDNAKVHDIHVNYAWSNPDDVLYETYPAGQLLQVAPPNSGVTTDEIPSHLILKTNALQSTRRVISHCAHYYFNRVCNRGSECYFIHAVSLTPLVIDGVAIEDRTRRIWGRTQTKKNPPTPTPTPGGGAASTTTTAATITAATHQKQASTSGFETPSQGLSRNDSSVRLGGGGQQQHYHHHHQQQQQQQQQIHNTPPSAVNGQGNAFPSLGQIHAAFLSAGGSTQDLTKMDNRDSDNSTPDSGDASAAAASMQQHSSSQNHHHNQQYNNNNNNKGSKPGSKSNSNLSSPFRRTHNPYSMTNPVVRSYNGSPVSPVPVPVIVAASSGSF